MHAWVNAVESGAWAVFAATAFALCIAQLTGTSETAYIFLYVGSLACFAGAYSMSMGYAYRVADTPFELLRSPTEVAIWCNRRM